jgi:hypothetical protein
MGVRVGFEGRLAAAGFVLAASLAAGVAGAQTPEFTLDWHAPAECPSEVELAARVEQLRGEHGASAATLDVRAFVTLLLDGRFRAELRLVQGGGERVRVLEAPTCRGLAEASAVVIALAMSPRAKLAEAAPPPAPPALPAEPVPLPEEEAPPSGRADAERAPPTPHERHEPHAFGIDASAGIATDFGATADTPALGATVLGRFRYEKLVSVGVRGSFFPARASTVPGQPNEGARVFLAAFAPLVCAAPFALPVELAACAELELGFLHAEGFGPPIHSQKSAWWVAPGAGLTAAFPKGTRLRSRLSADALFPTTRTEFVLRDIGVAHRLPVVAPRIALYLELAFP